MKSQVFDSLEYISIESQRLGGSVAEFEISGMDPSPVCIARNIGC